MTEHTDNPVVVTPQPTLKARFVNRKTAKRVGITAVVIGALVWLKSKLNASGSVSADVHVDNSEEPNN